ncbi:hypothetical protein DEU35_3399 [Microbacterium sp. AG157]|nr:hypothetical protein DEU35_3399 [Microbacterium sp. AG157]
MLLHAGSTAVRVIRRAIAFDDVLVVRGIGRVLTRILEGDDAGCHVHTALVIDEFDLFDDDDFAVGDTGRSVERIGRDLRAPFPLRGFVSPSQFLEHRSPRGEEGRTPLERAIRICLGNLEFLQSAIGLSEVETRTGHRDRQLHAHGDGQRRAVDSAPLFERAVRATDAALTVDDQRKLFVGAGDTAVRAQLAKRQGEIPHRVSGDGDRLSDHADASRASGCRQRVLVGELRVLVNHASRHREVAGDVVGVVLAEGLQLVARRAREIEGGDLLGDLGPALATILGRPRGSRVLPVEPTRRPGTRTTVARRTTVRAGKTSGISVTTDRTIPVTAHGPVTITTERTIPVTTEGTISIATHWTISITTHGPVTVTTHGTLTITTERTIPVTTEGTISIATHRTISITTHGPVTVTTHGTLTITTERTITVTTHGPVTLTTHGTLTITTERTITVTMHGPVTLTTHGTLTITTERTIPVPMHGPVTVTTHGPVTVTRGATRAATVTTGETRATVSVRAPAAIVFTAERT